MKRFRITYIDPESGEIKEFEDVFEDTPANPGVHAAVSARDWAVDAAYAASDKGWFKVEEVASKSTP